MYKCLTVAALVLLVLTGAMGLRNIANAATFPGSNLSASAVWASGPGPIPPIPGGGGHFSASGPGPIPPIPGGGGHFSASGPGPIPPIPGGGGHVTASGPGPIPPIPGGGGH